MRYAHCCAQPANPFRGCNSGAATKARRAAHPGDVGTGVAHDSQVSLLQLPRHRHKEAGRVCIGHQPRERQRRLERAQPGPGLVGGVEQQAARIGARGDVEQGRRGEIAGSAGVGIGDRDDATAAGAPDRGRCQRNGTRRAADPSEADLHEERAGRCELARRTLDLILIGRVAEGGGDRTRARHRRLDLA
jgi:hypothetical protein